MPNNRGVFNRSETIMRAQQEYDLYSFIAQRPQNQRHKVSSTEDKLTRIIQPSEPIERGKGGALLKNLIKMCATVPMFVVYVGPYKVAQILKPILQKVIHLIPHLLEGFTLEAQKLLQKMQPPLNLVKVFMDRALHQMKTTLERVMEGLNQAGGFLKRHLVDSLPSLPRFEFKLPEFKMPPVKEWLANTFNQLADDLRSEFRDIGRFFQKASQLIPRLEIPELPTINLDPLREYVQSWKKGKEKVVQAMSEIADQVRQIPEIIVPKLQMMVAPMVNLTVHANELFRHTGEKMRLSINEWMKHMGGRYNRFMGHASQVARRLMEKVLDVVGFFEFSWMRRFYVWLQELLGELMVWLIAFAARLKARPVDLFNRAKHVFSQVMKEVLPLLSKVPDALYWIVEWAFGKPGVLVIQGLSYLYRFALKSVRYMSVLLREVISELSV